MDDAPSDLNRAFAFQIAGCEGFGSRFSAAVLRIIIDDIEGGGPYADLARPWLGWDAKALIAAAAPLRLLGGLHYLVLSGADPALAAQFPAARGESDLEALRRVVVAAGRAHAAVLAGFTKSPPQTNEARRSLCLVGGFLTVARETGLPLRCLEIGASAGLNLNWDRYVYDLGVRGAWGDRSSPVRLDGEWEGAPPPFDVAAEVAERLGCDRAPIDLSDPDRALRLQAYVWADQPERLARLRGAIALARRFPPRCWRPRTPASGRSGPPVRDRGSPPCSTTPWSGTTFRHERVRWRRRRFARPGPRPGPINRSPGCGWSRRATTRPHPCGFG
jgi:hypothetical protein